MVCNSFHLFIQGFTQGAQSHMIKDRFHLYFVFSFKCVKLINNYKYLH